MRILVIDNWSVSIRPCELDNFADIFGNHTRITSGTKEYKELMKFLTITKMSLTELITSSEDYYHLIKSKIIERAKVTHFFDVLDYCRDLVLKDLSGSNIIRYLLYKLNNKVIKRQLWGNPCEPLSNLYLSYECIPFDEMPYNTSLRNHNPRLCDLFECIPVNNRDYELFCQIY